MYKYLKINNNFCLLYISLFIDIEVEDKSEDKESSIITLQKCEAQDEQEVDSELEDDDYFINLQPREKSRSELHIRRRDVKFYPEPNEDIKNQLRWVSPGLKKKWSENSLAILFEETEPPNKIDDKEYAHSQTKHFEK